MAHRAVDLDSFIKKAGEGRKRKVVIEPNNFYYASIKDVLGRLILHPDFKKMTAEYADPDPDVLDCYLKGSNAKKNEVLILHPDALRIILYYDEIELATGLGSHASNQQKVGAFYFTLENIQPQYRSSLKSICLVGLVNYDFISLNPERYTTIILNRIASDLKELENGCLINREVVYATLISVTGDHAGVHLVTGLKRGFTAHRFCRWCNLTLEETHVCTKSDPTRRRTEEQYEAEIGEMERCKTLKQRDAKGTKYGINWRCPLNALKTFHVVSSCPPDLMHTLFEGALSRAVKHIIIHCVSGLKNMTLAWLNSALSDFDYGFSEKSDKPSPIKEAHLDKDGNLHQSSAQLWTLAVILPLIVGQYVPEDDEHWENYSQILEITRITHAPDIHKDSLPYLNDLTSSYLCGHLKLYGEFPAKEHFLTHLAEVIAEFGTLLTYTCMRMEAHHKWFKRWTHLVNNFINTPKMLSVRYLLNQAVTFSRTLIKTPQYGMVTRVRVSELPFGNLLRNATEVVLTKSLKCNGLVFKEENCYICVGVDANMCPQFAKVRTIIVWPQIVLVCEKVAATSYDPHLSAYEIKGLMGQTLFYQLINVKGRRVFHAHACQNSQYISLKESFGNSF